MLLLFQILTDVDFVSFLSNWFSHGTYSFYTKFENFNYEWRYDKLKFLNMQIRLQKHNGALTLQWCLLGTWWLLMTNRKPYPRYPMVPTDLTLKGHFKVMWLLIRFFSGKWGLLGTWRLWMTDKKSYQSYPMVSIFITCDDLERSFEGHVTFNSFLQGNGAC